MCRLPLDDLHRLVGIAADFADLVEGRSGDDELAGGLRHVELGGLPAERQTVTIHGHHSEHSHTVPLKQLAVWMGRLSLVETAKMVSVIIEWRMR